MKEFPDESGMARSEDGSEPIRGGSIGLNRILGMFVAASATDNHPRFTGAILSAFTIFRNVWAMNNTATLGELEEGFARDINLFLDYYDTYLSHVKSRLAGDRRSPVALYFPGYDRVPKEIEREHIGKRGLLMAQYKQFLSKHGTDDAAIKRMENVSLFTLRAGDATYPHREVVRKFKDIGGQKGSLYSSGDPVAVLTHVPLDLHMTHRLRGVKSLESYTGRLKDPEEFRFRLDKEGRVPFQAAVHLVLGDDVLIKPMVTPKIRKELLETASKERWASRSEEDVRLRVSKITQIPIATLRKYDFV